MANMYDINSLTMIPSTNMDWYTKAIFGGKIIERGKITPITGVKDETLINLLGLDGNLLQADGGDCGWTPRQIAKLGEKPLKVKKYKINLEQCIDDLERKRTIWMLSPGAHNTELPDALEDATMAMLAPQLSKEIETLIFGGDSSKNADHFDGVVKKLTDSPESIKVQGVALTVDNVLSEYEKLYTNFFDHAEDALAEGTEAKTLSFYTTSSDILKVKMALSDKKGEYLVIRPNWSIDGDIISYMDIPLEPTKGVAKGTIILTASTNILFGTDLEHDLEELRLGQFQPPHDSKIFIDGHLRLGTVVVFEDEAGIYSPDVETASPEGKIFSAPIEFGYDGVSPVVDGIDQTPVHKLPLVKDLVAQINESEHIEDIEAILEIEAHTLRNSDTVRKTGEARITELKGGE